MDRDTDLTRQPFELRETVQGEDGGLYHLPTLRALYRRGRLSPDSPAYCALLQVLAACPQRARLIA